jgi:hypothetical protein
MDMDVVWYVHRACENLAARQAGYEIQTLAGFVLDTCAIPDTALDCGFSECRRLLETAGIMQEEQP